MTTYARLAGLTLALAAASSLPARAQTRPAPVVEVTGGGAEFLYESVLKHGLVGAGARIYLWPRLSVGPELTYMIGPGNDRDLFVTGNLIFDVLSPRAGTSRRVTPFLLAGAGLMRHSNQFSGRSFSATGGAATMGLGGRAWVNRRTFVAMDARLGWEPHLRLAATVGVALTPD